MSKKQDELKLAASQAEYLSKLLGFTVLVSNYGYPNHYCLTKVDAIGQPIANLTSFYKLSALTQVISDLSSIARIVKENTHEKQQNE